jgi:hypothetical protein
LVAAAVDEEGGAVDERGGLRAEEGHDLAEPPGIADGLVLVRVQLHDPVGGVQPRTDGVERDPVAEQVVGRRLGPRPQASSRRVGQGQGGDGLLDR